MRTCYRCSAEWTELRSPGFQEVCEDCHSYWHCCANCALYAPGASNECRSPTTEPVSDREKGSCCEEFVFRNPEERDEPPGKEEQAKQRWDDMFST